MCRYQYLCYHVTAWLQCQCFVKTKKNQSTLGLCSWLLPSSSGDASRNHISTINFLGAGSLSAVRGGSIAANMEYVGLQLQLQLQKFYLMWYLTSL